MRRTRPICSQHAFENERSMNCTVLPEHILRLMSSQDRKSLGKGAMTADEAVQKFSAKREKEMHDIFSQWLNLNGIPFIHARTDKRSTIQVGWPDFTVIHKGRAVCVEFKMPYAKIDVKQFETIDRLQREGTPVFICHNHAEAIEHLKRIFK